MIITDDFVVLNYPKTGSSFVREALKTAYWNRFSRTSFLERLFYRLKMKRRPMFQELFLPNIKVANMDQRDQHGTYEQIPPEFKDREVVTAIRNPYERLMSAYEHRHWVKFPPVDQKTLSEAFPHFPDLSFEEFLAFNEVAKHQRIPHITINADIGIQTIQFIQMFFKDPIRVLRQIDEEYLESDRYRQDMPDITFLRTENLNQDLYEFLLDRGHEEPDIAFILKMEKVNVSRDPFKKYSQLWNKKLVDMVRHKERFLFRILKDFGHPYKPPIFSASGQKSIKAVRN
jgi:hypothetical protein